MATSWSAEQVEALVEDYQQLAELADTSPRGMRWLILLIDLNVVLEQLTPREWEVVLLHGLLGIPARETAQELAISHTAVVKRYRQALEYIHWQMNGGTD